MALMYSDLLMVATTAASEPTIMTTIADFTTHNAPKMKTVNDPVMGGTSFSTCQQMKDGSGLVWEGEVQIVSFLGAPGFCILETDSFSSAALLEYGTELCFLIDDSKDSKLLLPMSVQISVGDNPDREGKTYSADLRLQPSMNGTGKKEFCAPLTSDAFKFTFRGREDPSAPRLDQDLLGHTTQIRLSTYSSHTAGPFKVKLMKIYTKMSAVNPKE